MVFGGAQKPIFELGQSSVLIPGVLMIELGEDPALMDIIAEVKRQHPDVKIAL